LERFRLKGGEKKAIAEELVLVVGFGEMGTLEKIQKFIGKELTDMRRVENGPGVPSETRAYALRNRIRLVEGWDLPSRAKVGREMDCEN